MWVDSRLQHRFDGRQQVTHNSRAARDPLHPPAPVSLIRTVKGAPREKALHPPEKGLVSHMHAHVDLCTDSVDAEMAFADQQAHDQPALEVVQVVHVAEQSTPCTPLRPFAQALNRSAKSRRASR
jgi:hypothetical protein